MVMPRFSAFLRFKDLLIVTVLGIHHLHPLRERIVEFLCNSISKEDGSIDEGQKIKLPDLGKNDEAARVRNDGLRHCSRHATGLRAGS